MRCLNLRLIVVAFASLQLACFAQSFAPYFDIPLDSSPQDAAFADVDGDGLADVIVAPQLVPNSQRGFLAIRNSSSPGTFRFEAPVSFGANASINVAAGDLDGDGLPDVVTAESPSTIRIFRNESSSGKLAFTPGPEVELHSNMYSVQLGDLDNDGRPEILATTVRNVFISGTQASLIILPNRSSPGTIAFDAPIVVKAISTPAMAAVIDLDGDGRNDVLVADRSAGVTVFHNSSPDGIVLTQSLQLYAINVSPDQVAAGDLNGDRRPDVVMAPGANASLGVFSNLSEPGALSATSFGNQSIGTRITPSVGAGFAHPTSIAIADLNADGWADLVTANSFVNTLTVILNPRHTELAFNSFQQRTEYNVGVTSDNSVQPMLVEIEDMDGDGRPDVVAMGYAWKKLVILRNTMNAAVPVPETPSLGITRTGQQIEVSWPLLLSGYTLEESSSIGAGVLWQAVSTTATQEGGRFRLLLNQDANVRFFRLKRSN